MKYHSMLAALMVTLATAIAGCGNDGFVPLFDGKTLGGWHADGGDIAAWKAEDGILRCTGGGGGWLATDATYSDFILELDWKISEGGNSGVGLRFPPQSHVSQTGMEIQILDDNAAQHSNIKPAQHTGSIYYQVPSAQTPTNPLGEWNHYRITCDGPLVVIELNGTEITRANMDEHTVGEGGLTPLSERPRSGHIGVQNHQTGVDFRNIRIKILNGE